MEIKLKLPIRELLRSACSGDYTPRHLQELYRLSYTIARHLVRKKILSGRLQLDILGMNEADITHDSIIELFTLGNQNELREISKYFAYQNISIETKTDEMLIILIRRLVFNVVNDNIFRLYNEADPALGRILRNLKLAVGNQTLFRQTIHFDEQYLELTNGHDVTSCADPTDEYLQDEIYQIITSENEIPAILKKFASVLARQDLYQRQVKLIPLALAIKNGYVQMNKSDLGYRVSADAKFVELDADRIIKQACKEVENEMKPRYVSKKKVDEMTFGLYMKVLDMSLIAEFIDGTDGQISYFEHFQKCMPELTRGQYLKNHRTTVEYLGKILKKRVKERLKEIL